uniref:Uncharacterized protein n=1 Tax=Arundo donax TaxID=35708 RepID=A0A0A8XNR5_ARUDO
MICIIGIVTVTVTSSEEDSPLRARLSLGSLLRSGTIALT